MSDPFDKTAPKRRRLRGSDPLDDYGATEDDPLSTATSQVPGASLKWWQRLPVALKISLGGSGVLLVLVAVIWIGTSVWDELGQEGVVRTQAQQSQATDSHPVAAEASTPTTPNEAAPASPWPTPATSLSEAVTRPGDAAMESGGEATAEVDADQAVRGQEVNWSQLALSVVLVVAADCDAVGSGTLIRDGSYVLTNSHVVRSGSRPCRDVGVAFIENVESLPQGYILPTQVVADDPVLDLAVLRIGSGAPRRPPIHIEDGALDFGDEIVALGFPDVGGSSITLTWGRLAGTLEDGSGATFYKTDAMLNPGISGGAAFDASGRFIGVPTAGSADVGGSLGLIRPAAQVLEFLDAVLP